MEPGRGELVDFMFVLTDCLLSFEQLRVQVVYLLLQLICSFLGKDGIFPTLLQCAEREETSALEQF